MSRSIAPLAAALVCCSLGTPAAAVSNNLPSEMPARILAAHNAVRARAGVPPLSWDASLGDSAANYAVYLALTNSFQHSGRDQRGGTGENLWMGTRGAYSYESMIAGWTSEQRYFRPGLFPSVSRSGNWEDVGHYT
ncbi:MAG TPA: CAP domain-containing protein, partial [Sphingomicrobium sp.]|nr:CAP domain-containing protein [Sphingomicrobium sp.]